MGANSLIEGRQVAVALSFHVSALGAANHFRHRQEAVARATTVVFCLYGGSGVARRKRHRQLIERETQVRGSEQSCESFSFGWEDRMERV